jgi:hypothetical protein
MRGQEIFFGKGQCALPRSPRCRRRVFRKAAAKSISWLTFRRCWTFRRRPSSTFSATCHQPPFYTDNLMHNLQTERFFKPVVINNMMAVGDGPIKTFPLRATIERRRWLAPKDQPEGEGPVLCGGVR